MAAGAQGKRLNDLSDFGSFRLIVVIGRKFYLHFPVLGAVRRTNFPSGLGGDTHHIAALGSLTLGLEHTGALFLRTIDGDSYGREGSFLYVQTGMGQGAEGCGQLSETRL